MFRVERDTGGCRTMEDMSGGVVVEQLRSRSAPAGRRRKGGTMIRRAVTIGVATVMAAACLVGIGAAAGVASATTPPVIELTMPQGAAFAIIGHSCGGIQEDVYLTGFDPTSGFPQGVVDVHTSCGGSGKGGGGHSTTYSGSADVTWDFTGVMVTDSAPATWTYGPPPFSATDANGNQIYDQASALNWGYLQWGPTFTPQPRVTGITATQGPASGGTAETIYGTGFTGAGAVDFGSVPAASFTVVNDNTVTAVSPVAPAGVVDVTVTSPGGTDATSPVDQFTFVAAPTITSVSPNSGPINGGTPVVITGTNLAAVTSVDFGGYVAAISAQSDTSITVTTPAFDAVDGASVQVTSVGGVASAPFTFTAPDICGAGCAITSATSTSAVTGSPFSFTVTTTGGVIPTFAYSGKLPFGVTLVDNYDGTATLSGTPTVLGKKKPHGTYHLKISATWSYTPPGGITVARTITQKFTLVVA